MRAVTKNYYRNSAGECCTEKPAFSGQVVNPSGGVQVPSRLAKQPEGLGLDGFCSPTTIDSSGRKMHRNETDILISV